MSTPTTLLRRAMGFAITVALLSGCGSTVSLSRNAANDASNVLGLSSSLGGSATPPVAGDVNPSQGVSTPGAPSLAVDTGSSGRPIPSGIAPGDSLPPSSGPMSTQPLKLGVLDVGSSTAAVSALGGTAQTSINEKQLSRGFVAYLNAHGGVAGRRLQMVEYTQNPNSSDYQNDLSAACAKFTQDNHVAAVLQAQLGAVVSENYDTCLSRAGVTSLSMTFATGDDSVFKRHPLLYDIAAPSVDRRMRAVFTGLNDSGYFTSKNIIGVLVEDCPESEQAYKNTVVPLAKSLELKLEMRTVSCLRGFSGAAGLAAQVQSAVLPFRSAGVDRVTFISGWEALMLLFFETNAAQQGWDPQYGLSSNSPVGATSGQFSNSALSRMKGIGWSPNTDIRGPLQTPQAKKCDAMARAEGFSAQKQADVALVRAVCDLFLTYKSAVEAAGGRDDAASLTAGLVKASKTYPSAVLLGGGQQLSAYQHDAASKFAEFSFVASCSCFKYVGQPRAIS